MKERQKKYLTPLEFTDVLHKESHGLLIFASIMRHIGAYYERRGYEVTHPLLVKYRRDLLRDKIDIEKIAKTPDYRVTLPSGQEIDVEVKFRDGFTLSMLAKDAKSLMELGWPEAFMFIVTPFGLFFDSCKGIVDKKGNPMKISSWDFATPDLEANHLELLQKWMGK